MNRTSPSFLSNKIILFKISIVFTQRVNVVHELLSLAQRTSGIRYRMWVVVCTVHTRLGPCRDGAGYENGCVLLRGWTLWAFISQVTAVKFFEQGRQLVCHAGAAVSPSVVLRLMTWIWVTPKRSCTQASRVATLAEAPSLSFLRGALVYLGSDPVEFFLYTIII